MLRSVASFVDQPLVRVVLGLGGLCAGVLFGPLSAVLALDGLPNSPETFGIGLAGCLGLVGWFGRIALRFPTLACHPGIRYTLAVFLAAGIAASLLALYFWPAGPSWTMVLLAMAATGGLLLMGTLPRGSGPNNSFKPKPLRGSA